MPGKVKESKPITLTGALKTGRLQEFVKQAEASGIGPATVENFDEAVRRVATQPRPEDRTSRFRRLGGLTGK
jgi:hypothetical protein